MLQNKPWLIIAQSGRALAISAARAGFKTHIIDRFGDLDTYAVAEDVTVLDEIFNTININQLLNIIDRHSDIGYAGVVTGSGFEEHPEILEFIHQYWPLYGNDANTVLACKDPKRFFGLLENLHIRFPEIKYEQTFPDTDWLIKRSGGSGGFHISRYRQGDLIPEGCYLQKKINGRSLSVVFLADGSKSRLVGINEIWPVDPENDDYRYLGAMTVPGIELHFYDELEAITQKLVRALKLKGLCGIDFIIDQNNRWYVLEINPRPTATFELHERDMSLFEAHIQACNGSLQSMPEPENILNAHKVIYAIEDFKMPEFDWPIWASDRPATGSFIRKNHPVCMIHAQATDVHVIHQLLNMRTQALQQLIPMLKLAA